MLTCLQVSQLVSQSLDRQLTWRERVALRLHLFICKYCKRFGQQLRSLRVAIKRLADNAESDANITMPSEAKARIAATIKMMAD